MLFQPDLKMECSKNRFFWAFRQWSSSLRFTLDPSSFVLLVGKEPRIHMNEQNVNTIHLMKFHDKKFHMGRKKNSVYFEIYWSLVTVVIGREIRHTD